MNHIVASRGFSLRTLCVALAGIATVAVIGMAQANNLLIGCTVSAIGVAFGTYTPGSELDSNGSVTVSCKSNLGIMGGTVNPVISISAGSSGRFASRTMSTGALTLQYNLYTSSTYTQVWGDGTGGSSTVTDTVTIPVLSSAPVTATNVVYGQIPAADNPAPGTYSDTITVTVTY
jgi:spore coat protein U-like protein